VQVAGGVPGIAARIGMPVPCWWKDIARYADADSRVRTRPGFEHARNRVKYGCALAAQLSVGTEHESGRSGAHRAVRNPLPGLSEIPGWGPPAKGTASFVDTDGKLFFFES
jgi:hypothetical protein